MEEEECKDEEEEEKPWEQESSAPGSQSVACQAENIRGARLAKKTHWFQISPVTHCGETSKKCEEAAGKNHPVVLVLYLVGQGHGDEGDATDEVADVKEKEASEEGEGGSEEPRGLLAGPQAPEGGGEVPHCVHRRHLLLTEEH